MSNQVPVSTIQSYTNMAQLLLQQKESKLMSRVMKKNYTGKAAKAVEQIGKVAAREKTTRHSDVEYSNTPHAARWIHPKEFYVADLIDNADKLKALIELQPSYMQSQMAGLARKIDEEIITQAFGTAYTGENGTTSEAWSATYEIASGSQGLTMEKIRDAKRLMMSADWDPSSEEAFIVVSSQQMDDLMGLTQVTSADFNGARPVLVDGTVAKVMGLNVVTVSDSILPVASSTRDVLVFARSGIMLGEWDSMKTTVDRIPTKHNSLQVLTQMMLGVTRTELGKIVKIKCAE